MLPNKYSLTLLTVLAGCGIDKPIDVADSMPLRKQPVTVLLQGLNQKAPGTTGVLGQLEVAENTRISKGTAGGFELVRRNGVVEVADLVFGPSLPFRMVSYGGAIVVSDGLSGVQTFSPTTQSFAQTGAATNGNGAIGISRTDLQAPLKPAAGTQTPTQSSLDVAFIGNRGCYVWVDQDGIVNYVIREASGGAPVASGVTNASGGSNTKVVALGTAWVIFWKEANAIVAYKVASDYTHLGPGTVVAAGSCLAGTDYDVQVGASTTQIALIYRIDATHHGRAFVTITGSFVVSGLISDATAADQPDVAMCWLSQPTFGASLYYATLNAANGLKVQTINATTLAITATATQAGAPVTNVSNMTGASAYTSAGSIPYVLIDRQITDGSGVTHRVIDEVDSVSGVSSWMSNVSLVSRVGFFGSPSAGHVAVLYNSSQAAGTVVAAQPTLFIARTNNTGGIILAEIEAKAMPGAAGAHTTFALTTLSADSGGALHGNFAHAVQADTGAGVVALQYQVTDVAIALRPAVVSAPIVFGGVALFPGGEVVEVDLSPPVSNLSFPIHEQGFRVKPEIPKLVEGAAASGSVAPGTRSYIVRWKWVDSNGQEYVSATSTPVAITTVNANSSVQVSVYGPDATTTRRYVQAEILRTPVSGTGDEYFRVTPSVFAVDPFARAVITFTDTASETTLAAGEPLDTSATAELDNIAPPALNDIIEHKTRPFGIDAEQPWRIRFGKPYTPGTSVAFTDTFFMDTPSGTGPIYKLMSMDGHLIAIKRDTIYVFSGDYPDADGTGPTIPQALQLPVGVGTEQPRSVVLTDLGIIFYSSKRGFWVLTRSLAVDYIGAPVETTAASQTVSGATVHPTYPEVRFTTEGGTTFVLNTYFTRIVAAPIWTTFTGQACVHSIVHNGDWYLLTSAGKLLKEDLTRWQDGVALGGGAFTAGATYTRRVKVSDINFAGVAGFARVYEGTLLGEWYASERVKLTITDNHRVTDPATGLPAAENAYYYDATINPDPYMLSFEPATQKVTSVDVQLEDTADYQTQGSAWTALNFIVGVKGGPFRQGQGKFFSGGARK